MICILETRCLHDTISNVLSMSKIGNIGGECGIVNGLEILIDH